MAALEGQPSLDEALADLVISGSERGSKRRRARSSGFTRTPPVAFGGLFDLMRFRTRDARRDEICEECKTLNRCDACFCKTCMHKLPAYYTSADPQLPLVIWRRRARSPVR